MPPLRVLSIATLFPDAARPNFGLFVEKSLRALAAEPGIDLTIVAPVGLPPFPLSLHRRYRALRDLPPAEQRNGLTVLRPRFTLIPRYGARFNPAAVARAVLAAVQNRPFDVVDAQFFYPDGPAAMRVADALGLPFSVKARGADISHFGHDPATRSQVIEAGAKAAGLLAVSDAMRCDMAAIGVDPAKVAVHYTGIDTARFHPGDRAAARAALGMGGAPAILTVGALIARKGQALVIDALPALPGVHYWIAGAGEEEARYRVRARDLGVEPRVHFLGSVANVDLPQLYRAADVVVMPSVSEGLANAWVEALACGTPIVISDAGGAAELVTSPVAGRIVARTPEAIADAVRAVIADPPAPSGVAASLGGRFDWDRNGRELADHLRRCAGR
ncbi:glycosyltransferase [Sphingopyxis sp. JAI108]|uniref:glycosyltransferase n=1 Tax=Sphingopyxis sp. JAI108 TaxID=2723060 RepID=UPI0015CBD55C|nr:glycosyltransferase [Sphingopyxis sp. JAI108]NYF33537.1 glycosyltransferase involved in cell wall biosynthesis [Sphingopyxis sp. JAI108]